MKMKLLTKEQHESYANAKICHICKEEFKNKYLKYKKYRKGKNHCNYIGAYKGAAHCIYDLKYSVPEKFLIGFHIESNYDYNFVIKTLGEFKKQFTCLREIIEKYITFTVPIEQEVTWIYKNGEEITTNMLHITIYW